MRAKDLKHGEFFHSQCVVNTIGRKVNQIIVYFDMGLEADSPEICDKIESWEYQDIVTLTPQEALLLLVKECANNPPTEQKPTLADGEWWLDELGNIGRVFHPRYPEEPLYVCLQETGSDIHFFGELRLKPLTRQEALLLAVKNIL